MDEKNKILTPSLRGFYENIGRLKGIKLYESKLNTCLGDIVLFTGSILDKSEIDYREITMSQGKYYTVIPDGMNKEDIDEYWIRYTTVLCKSEAIQYLVGFKNKNNKD